MLLLRLVVGALGLCAGFMVAVAAAMLIGRSQPFPRSVDRLHLLDCPPPCWIGIIPGETTVASAKANIVAAYAGQDDLSIKDAGFAGVPIYANVVEINIEGKQFFLYIRLNTSEPVDGKNEIVQSIGLFTTREDRHAYAPSVADILATFGRPRQTVQQDALSGGGEITLHYDGWQIESYVSRGSLMLAEVPRFYLGNAAP
jgi:hypothetical protein